MATKIISNQFLKTSKGRKYSKVIVESPRAVTKPTATNATNRDHSSNSYNHRLKETSS